MSKIHALITTIVLGLSSTAMASPSFSLQARASARVSFGNDMPETVHVRDHRTEARFQRTGYESRYQPRDRYLLDLTGTYSSIYGEVTITQRGNRVFGTFNAGGAGVIEGQIVGNKIYFVWRNTGAQGRGVWMLDRNADLAGTWGYNNDAVTGGSWNLQFVR